MIEADAPQAPASSNSDSDSAARIRRSEKPDSTEDEVPTDPSAAVDAAAVDPVIVDNLLLSQAFEPQSALTTLVLGVETDYAAADTLVRFGLVSAGFERPLLSSPATLNGESEPAVLDTFGSIVADLPTEQEGSASVLSFPIDRGAIASLPARPPAWQSFRANTIAGESGTAPAFGHVQTEIAQIVDQPQGGPGGPLDSATAARFVQSQANLAAAAQPIVEGNTYAGQIAGELTVVESAAPAPAPLAQSTGVLAAAAAEEQSVASEEDVSADGAPASEGEFLSTLDSRSPASATTPGRRAAISPIESPVPTSSAVRPGSGTASNGADAATFSELNTDDATADIEPADSRADFTHAATAGFRSAYRSATVQALPGDVARIAGQVADAIVTQAVMTEIGDTLTLDAILDPPDLGRLHVRLTRTQSGLSAHLSAENGDVQHIIAEHAASIEQTVRTHLKTGESMQFVPAESPFGDGSAARGGREQPQRPTLRSEAVRHLGKPEQASRAQRGSQAEIDVLA